MAKKGRKPIYETVLKPHLKEIGELVKKGLTEREIMQALNVSSSVWYAAKLKYKEFSDTLNMRHRLESIEKLEAAALKAACGYKYEEQRRIYKPADPEAGMSEPVLVGFEVTEKHQPANSQLNRFLLQNWGKEYGYTADPLQQALKRDELEFRKAQKLPQEWDDEDADGV